MGKKYTVIYTNGTGAPARAKPAIVAPNGKLICTRVPLYSEGRLTKLTVRQVGGTPKAFTVELFCSKYPVPVGAQTLPYTYPDDASMYRVITQKTGGVGVTEEFVDDATGFPFQNFDGTSTNNQPYLYLVITPTSSIDDTTWEVSITGVLGSDDSD